MDMTYQLNNAFGKVVAGIIQQNPGTTPEQAQQMAMNMFSQMGIDLTKGVTDEYNAEATFGLPQSISAGIAFAPSKKIRIGLDAEWINWKKHLIQWILNWLMGQTQILTGCLVHPELLKWLSQCIGKMPLLSAPEQEFDATDRLGFRAGYAYGSNPVPETTIFPLFPAIVKHHVTAGGSFQV